MKKFRWSVFLSIAFSVFLHAALFFVLFMLLKPKELPIPKPPEQVFVDVVSLPEPKKAVKQKSQSQEKHKIAANIQRKGVARVYSKQEKIPLGQAKSRSVKPRVSKNRIEHKTVFKKPSRQKKESSGINRQKKSNIVKIKGGLFREGVLNKKSGFASGTSSQYEYKNAKREATISIGTQQLKYASYMAKLKNKIQAVWVYPNKAIQTGQQGALLILFSIDKNGRLVRLKLIRSSGYPVLDDAALQAVRDASPFAPLPKRLGIDVLNIYATFEYKLSNYFIY
ncbi:energy transducer TonB family protein [Hippea sp. KM1]|uniref:energy transducer TonB family protein n=1 Tax=Hippea sp. KM1 TaxID=944481 RepID=UPI00046CE762|nr:energy transducer TonB [Hippea sp. KM1]